MKAQYEEMKAAFSDLVQRRNAAMDLIRAREAAIAARFAEASKLQGKLVELNAAKQHSDAKVGELQRQLEQAARDIHVVRSNQREADDEVDEANRIISDLNAQIEELNGKAAAMQDRLDEADAINQGLEDDKEEMQTELTQLKAAISETNEKHARELVALQGSAAQVTSAASVKVVTLTHQMADTAEKLLGAEKSVKVRAR